MYMHQPLHNLLIILIKSGLIIIGPARVLEFLQPNLEN